MYILPSDNPITGRSNGLEIINKQNEIFSSFEGDKKRIHQEIHKKVGDVALPQPTLFIRLTELRTRDIR